MDDAASRVRAFYEAVWTKGELHRAGDFLAPELLDHDALPFPGRLPGADGLIQVVGMIRSAIPDLVRTIDAQVVDGERVATRFTDQGTHRGELLGVPATGRTVSVRGINIELVRDGRIVETWHVEDLAGLMAQIQGDG